MPSVIFYSVFPIYPERGLPHCFIEARIADPETTFLLPWLPVLHQPFQRKKTKHWLISLLSLIAGLLLPGSFLHGQSLPDVPDELIFAGVPVHLSQQGRLQIQQEIQRLYAYPRTIQTDISALRELNPFLKPLLTRAGLPDDFRFVALPFSDIDSIGFWAVSPSYARELRLRMDSNVDERYHPLLSTEAAVADLERIQALKSNYVLSLIRYLKGNTTLNVTEPADPAYIQPGPQSPPLLWKILARKLVIEHEEPTYRPAVNYILYAYPYGEGQTLQSIANRLRLNEERVKPYNQWLKTVIIPADKKYTVLVQVTPDEFTTVQALAEPGLRNLRQLAIGFPILIKLNQQGDGLRSEAVFYEINDRRGIQAQQCDNFITLAYYGEISTDKFIEFNDLNAKQDVIHPGLIYYLERKAKRAKVPFHVAQKNQTMLEIATIYGVRLASLLNYNQMTAAQRLQTGRIVWLQTERPRNQPIEYIQLPPDEPMPAPMPPPVIVRPSVPVQDSVRAITQSSQAPVVTRPSTPVQDSVRTPPRPKQAAPASKADSAVASVKRPAVRADSVRKALPPTVAKLPSQPVTKSPVQPAKSPIKLDTIRIGVAEKRKWHVVKPGQTYYAISRLYSISVEQLYAWNNLSEKIPLEVGQNLVVGYIREKQPLTATNPKPQSKPLTPKPVGTTSTRKAVFYTVKPGETLYRIALQNKVDIKDVLIWNNLKSNTIEIGQILVLWK